MRLAAVVITHNEEGNIERCLRSLRFCDERIVVDAESTDRTREIAAEFADKVVVRKWLGYAAQKNFALTLTDATWVLSIDADEEVTPELKSEIETVLDLPAAVAYSVPRKTIHFGRWIRHGGWYPNRLVRLFRKSEGRWSAEEVHEHWQTSGNVGELRGDLLHYSFLSLADQIDRNNHYSTLGAVQLQREGKRFSLAKMSAKTIAKFLECYFFKLGFLDGYPGLIIAVSASNSTFLKWAKLWELQNVGGSAAGAGSDGRRQAA